MKKISLVVLFLLLISLYLSCGMVKRYGTRDEETPQEPQSESRKPPEDEVESDEVKSELVNRTGVTEEPGEGIKVGVVLPLSGELSGFGQAILEGLLVAREVLQSQSAERIEFVLVDNAESYSTGSVRSIEIAERLRDEKVSAIIGPLTTPSVVTTALTLSPDSILILSPTSSDYDLPQVTSNVFSLNTPSPSLSRRIARFAVNELNLFRFSVLYPGDLYGQVMAESFIEEVEQLGAKVVITVSFPPSQTTYEKEIKTIALYYPEALYIPARSEDVIQIAPQIPYYGMYDVHLLGADGWNYIDVTRKGGEYVEGVYFSDSYLPESTGLIHDSFSIPYIEVYRKEPTRIAGWGYDALALIFDAYERGGSRAGALLEAFLDTSGFRGATARYTIVNGRMEREGFLFTISGGGIVTLESVEIDSSEQDTIEVHGEVWNENGG
jgi:branched-chain amino acid transport system substrate-binding protein